MLGNSMASAFKRPCAVLLFPMYARVRSIDVDVNMTSQVRIRGEHPFDVRVKL